MRELGKQTRLVSLCLLVVAATILPLLQAAIANAAELQPRSLTLVGGTHDGADVGTELDGATQPGGLVDHQFARAKGRDQLVARPEPPLLPHQQQQFECPDGPETRPDESEQIVAGARHEPCIT